MDEHTVRAITVTQGNANNFTPGTQGVCLEVEAPFASEVLVSANGDRFRVPLSRLVKGALARPLADMPAQSLRLHRAPLPEEFEWSLGWDDPDPLTPSVYYVRVRQRNDHWAWASPIFLTQP